MIHAVSGAMLYSRLVYQPEEMSSSVMLTRRDCLPSALGGNECVAGIASSRWTAWSSTKNWLRIQGY